MKLMITTAAIALAAVSAPAAAQMGYNATPSAPPETAAPRANAQATADAGPKVPKVSGKAAKAIGDLQNTVNKNDVANIPAKVAAAQAVASTPDDRYAIAILQYKAASAAKDDAAIAAAVDAIAKSGFEDSATNSKLYANVGVTQFNEKKYAEAAAEFQKAVAVDPRNVDAQTDLGQALALQGQKAEAAAAFQQAIQASASTGQKPSDDLYRKALQAAYDAHLPGTIDIARQWVAAYPTSDSWHNSIAIFRNMSHPDEEGTLDLLRLTQAVGAMTPGDYVTYAEAAADQSNYNEAQAVIDAGIAAHVVDPTSSEFRDVVAGLKGKPKATAADLEAAVKMSPNATNLLHIGDRYYGMGDYAKAAEIDRQVLTKPDADKDVANLHLGMALARAGDKAGATAALNAVGGSRAEIAKFWLTYLQQHA